MWYVINSCMLTQFLVRYMYMCRKHFVVCWSIKLSKWVLCESVFTGASAVGYAHYGQGTGGPVLLSNVHCTGLETYISDCPSSGFYSTYCSHAEDAGVACPSEQMYLSASAVIFLKIWNISDPVSVSDCTHVLHQTLLIWTLEIAVLFLRPCMYMYMYLASGPVFFPDWI